MFYKFQTFKTYLFMLENKTKISFFNRFIPTKIFTSDQKKSVWLILYYWNQMHQKTKPHPWLWMTADFFRVMKGHFIQPLMMNISPTMPGIFSLSCGYTSSSIYPEYFMGFFSLIHRISYACLSVLGSQIVILQLVCSWFPDCDSTYRKGKCSLLVLLAHKNW